MRRENSDPEPNEYCNISLLKGGRAGMVGFILDFSQHWASKNHDEGSMHLRVLLEY